MAWVFPDNEIIINARITYGAAWNDVDLGANNDVPAGTKAVVLHVRATNSAGTRWSAAVRPNGSNSARQGVHVMELNTHKYLPVSLDANRIFEGYFQDSVLAVGIVAYTDEECLFQTEVDKSLTVTGSYQDRDVSANGVPPGAGFAVLEIVNVSTILSRSQGTRRKGNTEDIYKAMWIKSGFGAFVGLDADRVYQQKIYSTNTDAYLWGYLGIDAVPLATIQEFAPGPHSSWQDCDCSGFLPANAIAAVLTLTPGTPSGTGIGVRKKGSTDNYTADTSASGDIIGAIVGLDNNRVFQSFRQGVMATGGIYVLGYVSGQTGISVPVSCQDIGVESLAVTPFWEYCRKFPVFDENQQFETQAGKMKFPRLT